MKKMTLMLCFLFCLGVVHSQTLTLGADIRPRFEYRHGFGTLFPDEAKPAAFVQQRSRLNLNYGAERFKLMFSFQDVSTWGDTAQLTATDNNDSFSMFQAWIQYGFNERFSAKLGRQVISYDDQRIFGGLDWAMQGRFHDALVLQYKNEGFGADLGVAFNQENPSLFGTDYTITNAFSYKTMQYLYVNKKWEHLYLSALFLNNGFQKYEDEEMTITDGVYSRQTTGIFYKVPVGRWSFYGTAYYQFGKATANTDLSAFEVAINADLKLSNHLFGGGFEMLSGTSQEGETTNKSFFPLFGTNHKFNGYMDYFYVGNHANNVGLNDLFLKYQWQHEKNSLLIKAHYFSAQADLLNQAESYLGTEVDLVFTHKVNNYIKCFVGYSHMFASNSMSLVKGGTTNDNTNNWAWAQIIVNPKLFEYVFK